MPTRLTIMRVLRSAIVLLVLESLGCTQPKPKPASPPQTTARGERPESTPPSAAPKLTSARVTVTGVLLRQGDAVEVCPGEGVQACAGIRVEGKVEDAWISERGKTSVWRLHGAFDGTKLVIDGPAQPTAIGKAPDYRNACPEFQEPKKGEVNPSMELQAAVEAFTSELGERVAGSWWDRARQAMVVWVTGDPSEPRARIAQRSPGARVCVQGQAPFSLGELERARAKADAILRAHGVVWSSSSGDVLRNKIVYSAETIDSATLAELGRETGDAIEVVAFIELEDGSVPQLPAPAPRGDVALVTQNSRGGAWMAALGRFSVHYDPAGKCVYFATPDGRVLPVWPFGYWATSNPLRIHDFDDKLIAEEGQTVELGGGQTEIQHVHAGNACGAKTAWIASP